jgi:capsid protein
VLGYVAPEHAARRMRAWMFMAIAGSFVGASSTRRSLKGWSVTANSADEDTVDDLEMLRARSRDMVRNTPLATGAIGTIVQDVEGTGLTLQAKPDWDAVCRNVLHFLERGRRAGPMGIFTGVTGYSHGRKK